MGAGGTSKDRVGRVSEHEWREISKAEGLPCEFSAFSKRHSAVGDFLAAGLPAAPRVTESEPHLTMSNFLVTPALCLDEFSARCGPRANPMARMATIAKAHARAAGERLRQHHAHLRLPGW